jgi:hypothetical protein
VGWLLFLSRFLEKNLMGARMSLGLEKVRLIPNIRLVGQPSDFYLKKT